MLTEEAIDRLAESETITAAVGSVSQALDTSGAGTRGQLALPDKFTLHDLEKYLPTRRRLRGAMNTSHMESFAAYVKDNQEAGAATLVDPAKMEAVAVLNLGTTDKPGHSDNTAKFTPRKTAAYGAMLAVAGQSLRVSQKVLAEFLEDNRDFITCQGEAEAALDLRKAIAAVRNMTIESATRANSQVGNLSAESTTFESVGAKAAETLPSTITFKCEPYLGFAPRSFVLRFSVFTEAKEPHLSLRIVNAEKHSEEMAAELVEKVQAALGVNLPVLVGTYAVGA